MKRQRGEEIRGKEVKGRVARGKKNRNGKFLFSIFAFCVFFTGCSSSLAQRQEQVCFQDACVHVEVVQKTEELRKGLQFRERLDPNSGMLFIFSQNRRHAFWMKNTLIPLDMIWMDDTRRVVHIEEDVPPCKKDPCPSYTPSQEAFYVLEVNAGYTAVLDLKVGDQAEFHLE